MSDFETIKKRIAVSLDQLNGLLGDYESLIKSKSDLNQKFKMLETEHLNDLNELNSLILELENLIGDSRND
tara:strand:+ start:563 stop:775 length:213 start_codon:yes stop_codon:yes gene_type:complete